MLKGQDDGDPCFLSSSCKTAIVFLFTYLHFSAFVRFNPNAAGPKLLAYQRTIIIIEAGPQNSVLLMPIKSKWAMESGQKFYLREGIKEPPLHSPR